MGEEKTRTQKQKGSKKEEMKERLTELLKGGLKYNDNPLSYCHDEHVGELAEHLLANGVIVLPCAVGDTVYKIWSAGKHGKSVAEFVITIISQIARGVWVIKYQKPSTSLMQTPTRYQCNLEEIGKTVFLTKSQAEEALNEQKKL